MKQAVVETMVLMLCVVDDPAGHVEQLVWPVWSEYCPAGHVVQLDCALAGWAVPMGQGRQEDRNIVGAYCPAAQSLQAVWPCINASWYLPRWHGTHLFSPYT
jgi:hypothetical protein